MGRKPNYRADRIERERAKATKKAKRLEAKTGKADKHGIDETPADEAASDGAETAKDEDQAEGEDRAEPDAS